MRNNEQRRQLYNKTTSAKQATVIINNTMKNKKKIIRKIGKEKKEQYGSYKYSEPYVHMYIFIYLQKHAIYIKYLLKA